MSFCLKIACYSKILFSPKNLPRTYVCIHKESELVMQTGANVAEFIWSTYYIFFDLYIKLYYN